MKGLRNLKSYKKSLLYFLFVVAFIFISFSLSFSSSGGAHSENLPVDYKDFLLKLINFLILFFVVIYFTKKPFKNFLQSRQKSVADSIKNADESLKNAAKEHEETKKKLAKLSEEIKEITATMQKEGELEKQMILKRTEELAKKIKEQTEGSVKREFDVVQKKIKETTIDNTIDSAEAILQSKFKAADQDKIAKMIAGEISSVKDIDVFLQNPVSAQLKKKVPLEIDTSKQVSEVTMNFIKVLLASDEEKRRNLDDIKKAYENYVSDVTGMSKAQIYSATDLDEPALSSITSSLKKAIGKDIEVEVIKDPSIIGGIVTKIGSLVFDASVKTQLENMRENLKNEVA